MNRSPKLTKDEKIALIESGAAKLNAHHVRKSSWVYWDDAFTFPGNEAALKAHATAEKKWKTTYASARKKLEKQAQKLRDQLMLGDAAEALAAIDKFAAE